MIAVIVSDHPNNMLVSEKLYNNKTVLYEVPDVYQKYLW